MSRLNPLIATGLISLLMAWSSQCAMAEMEQRKGSQHPTAPMLLVQAQPAQPRQDVEANISQLHQKLQITSAQEPQFSAVANVMRDNARLEASVPQPTANATAVDDLRVYIKYSELELAGLKKMLPSLEALYATLSPAQRKAADAIFRQGPGG
jgi:protein CpxP